MAALLQAGRMRERLVRRLVVPAQPGAGRRYRMADDRVEPLDDPAAAGDVVAVPTEQVLLLRVELPLATHRKRMEALPFAIEDRIADPLEAVHIVLGAELAPQTWLAAVVRHDAMRGWLEAADAAGLDGAALVPDALLLPPPPEGAWSIEVVGDRALVRSGDGTAFAIARTQLALAWIAAGRPPCIARSGGVPAEMAAVAAAEVGADDLAFRSAPLDLRQGRYAWRAPALSPLRRRVMTVAALGILAHGLIAAADTIALERRARIREAQTRALIAMAMPGVAAGDDLVSAAATALPPSTAGRVPDPFLPLLARVSAAAGPLAMTRLEYDRAGRRISIGVDSGQEVPLAERLNSSGLAATAGIGSVAVAEPGA